MRSLLHSALIGALAFALAASAAQAQSTSAPLLVATTPAGCEDAALFPDGSIRFGARLLGELPVEETALRRRAAHRSAALTVSGDGTCVVTLSLPPPPGMGGREPITQLWMISQSEVEYIGQFRASLDSHASIDSRRIVGLTVRGASVVFQEVESLRSACERRTTTAQRFAPRRWRFHSKSPGEPLDSGDEEPDGMFADCSERRRSAIRGAVRARRRASVSPEVPPTDEATIATVVVRARVVLVPGEEASEVVLWSDGRIQVGELETQVDLSQARFPPLDGTEVDLSRVIHISARCFSDEQNLLWLRMALRDQYEEDSFRRDVALTRDGGRLNVLFSMESHGAGWMTMESLGFTTRCGSGEVTRLRIGARTFDASGRITRPEDHDYDEAIFSPVEREVYRRRRGRLRLVEVQRTGLAFDRRSFAACPHVYVQRGGDFVMSGEILRHMVGVDAYGDQGLALGTVDDGLLRVELREEQHEVTHLDEIHLLLDGRPLIARECSASNAERPAFCEQDHRAHVMRYGDILRLHFDVSTGDAELRATGYYDAH